MKKSITTFWLLLAFFLSIGIAAKHHLNESGFMESNNEIPELKQTRSLHQAGTLMYGYCLDMTSEFSDLQGLISFYPSVLDEVKVISNSVPAEPLQAGEFYNGVLYAQTLIYSEERMAYIPNLFVSVNIATGRRSQLGSVAGETKIVDMAYSYKDNVMYGIIIKNTGPTLVTIPLSGSNAGKPTDIGVIKGDPVRYATLACHLSGQLYAIGVDGKLYKIDVDKLQATAIGDTQVRISDVPGGAIQNTQSMAFDHNTNTLYWSCEDGNFYNVDYKNGSARLLGKTGGKGAHFNSLFSSFVNVNEGVPGIVQALTATSGNNGGISLSLQWMNPVETAQGESNVTITKVKVYKNGQLVHTVDNTEPGREHAWTDSNAAAGDYTYKVVAENANGEGVPSSVLAVVGQDLPRPVKNVTLTKNSAGNPVLTWDPTTAGVNGGWLGNVTYEVLRMPGSVTMASNLTTTTFTDTEDVPLGNYYYRISAVNARGKSTIVNSDAVVLGAATIPWSDDLSNMNNSYIFWTGIDYNGFMWEWISGNSEFQNGCWFFNPIYAGIDDWLITPPLKLEVNKTYRLRYKEASADDAPHTYTIYMGRKNDPGNMTIKVTEGSIQSYNATKRDVILPVQTRASNYYIGFHSYSEGVLPYIYMDDFFVEEVKNIDLTLYGLTGQADVSVGVPVTSIVTVKNFGKNNATGFTVSIYDDKDAVLGTSETYTGTLKFEETLEIPVTWSAKAPANRESTIKAVVTLTGDEDLTNNSYTQNIRIYPTGTVKLSPNGYYAYLGYYGDMPFDFSKKASVNQTIFSPQEITTYGYINSLTYPVLSAYPIHAPIKIYMAKTDKTDLGDWYRGEATLVYEGNIDIPQKDKPREPKNLKITLDRPYLYDEGNLVIWTERVLNDKVYAEDSVLFLMGKTRGTNQPLQSAYWAGDEEFNFQTGRRRERYAFLELEMNVDGGYLKGKITSGSTPVEGVSVKIADTNFETVSDSQGNYTFNFLPKGNYAAVFYKKGYKEERKQYSITTSGVTENISLIAVSEVKVSGKVLKNGGAALPKAFVSLTSLNEKHYTFTDENGDFIIEGVTSGSTYEVSASYSGYAGYIGQAEIGNSDKVLTNITLSTCGSSKPPKNPSYTLNQPTWYSVKLAWQAPVAESSIKGYRIYRDDELVNYELVTDKSFVEEVAAGEYKYELATVLLNNCESQRVSLGTVTMGVYDCDIAFASFPLKESFDAGQLLNCWTQEYVSGMRYNWTFNPGGDVYVPSAPHSGRYYLRLFGDGKGAKSRLISPKMDISKLTAPVVTFWHAQDLFFGSQDILRVYYKNTPDGTWTLLKEYTGRIRDWTEEIIELPYPSNTYWVSFEGTINYGSGIALDDIRILDNVCQPVNNLRYQQETETSVKLLWEKPDGFDISSYKVKRDGVLIKENLDETTYLDEGLAMGTYDYEVIAVYNKTSCTESSPVPLEVVLGKVCDPVKKVELSIQSVNSLKISWEAPSSTGIESYTIRKNDVDLITLPVGTTEHTDTELAEGDYKYGVIVNYSGEGCKNSPVSNEYIFFYTGPVKDLSLIADYNNKVTLEWNMDKEDIASFNIYQDKALLTNVREQKYIVRELVPGKTYDFCVEPVYDAGFTGESECKTAVLECIAVDPTKAVVVRNGSTAELSWEVNEAPATRSDLIWDNGQYITHWGEGFNGANVSALSGGARATGFIVDKALGNANTDDFYLGEESHIDEMEFYIFQSKAPLEGSPIQAINVAIYDGNPAKGGEKIWGDYFNNNALVSTEFTNVFRSKIEDLKIMEYPIFSVRAKIDETLPAGKYWVAISVIGTGIYGSPYTVPVTILNATDTGDAYLFTTDEDNNEIWKPLIDPGHGGTLGMAFKVFGRKQGGVYDIYRDGKLIAENVQGNTYTDTNVPEGEHTWEIIRICLEGESGKTQFGTSIDDNNFVQDVKVYPNPARSKVTVEGNNVGRIEIFNTVGQVLKDIKGNGDVKQSVDLDGFAPGMYIFKIRTTDNKIVVKNIIVVE